MPTSSFAVTRQRTIDQFYTCYIISASVISFSRKSSRLLIYSSDRHCFILFIFCALLLTLCSSSTSFCFLGTYNTDRKQNYLYSFITTFSFLFYVSFLITQELFYWDSSNRFIVFSVITSRSFLLLIVLASEFRMEDDSLSWTSLCIYRHCVLLAILFPYPIRFFSVSFVVCPGLCCFRCLSTISNIFTLVFTSFLGLLWVQGLAQTLRELHQWPSSTVKTGGLLPLSDSLL